LENSILKTKIWKQKSSPERTLVDVLTQELNAPEIIAKMLVQRGIDSSDKVKKILQSQNWRYARSFLDEGYGQGY